jgi:hypothetical protein
MPSFLSNREKNVKIGIPSYTDNSTVVEVIGKVAIGTEYAGSELYVDGNSIITGILTVSNLKSNNVYVDGDIVSSGILSAKTLFGDGARLDNVVNNIVSPSSGEEPNYIGFLTTISGSFEQLYSSDGIVFIPSTRNIGIATTNPDEKLVVDGNVKVTGFVTAKELYGDQVIGTPSGGFLPGAVGIETSDFTKDSVNEINFILGKLIPKPPDNIDNAPFTLTGLTGLGRLCSGFSPINNAVGYVTPNAGTQYSRNVTNFVSSNTITEYGPGDAGTVVGYINSVGVGTTTLSPGSNNGLYGALRILNDKDAFFSTRNPGITSQFYEVYDARLENVPCPNGFNIAFIEQNGKQTQKPFWYEDPSTVGPPILTSSTPTPPSSPSLLYSSGVPHYTESSSNQFYYVITCENATGDMYTQSIFLTSSGQTTAFQNGGSKGYTNFAGGVTPPVRNFGVGVGVTCLISQIPRDLHFTATTDTQKFSTYTATTPYGTATVLATITQAVNIMGNTAITNKMDEDNILISSLGTGSGNARRVSAGASGDNPTPAYTSWNPFTTVALYESVVRGGVLRHDVEDYSNGSWLPLGPNYSSGRSGSQYFQLEIIRSQVSQFLITVSGSYSGCWVCMPDNPDWMASLSGVNGWANMFQSYRGAGIPSSAEPGCASGAVMNGSSGTFTCVFGTESSSNDSNNRILIRWKLNSNQSINTMSYSST